MTRERKARKLAKSGMPINATVMLMWGTRDKSKRGKAPYERRMDLKQANDTVRSWK